MHRGIGLMVLLGVELLAPLFVTCMPWPMESFMILRRVFLMLLMLAAVPLSFWTSWLIIQS
jgi:hypothetical protein